MTSNLAATGIEGLDHILNGGLQRAQLHLLRGPSGTGKTTLSLQFLLAGARRGEQGLYIGAGETESEVGVLTAAHGWPLDRVAVHHPEGGDLSGQTVFHSAEAELPRAIDDILAAADRVRPARIVIDSLSEIQLLAREGSWYYRQLLALKQHLCRSGATVLLTEIPTAVSAVAGSLVCTIIEMITSTPPHGVDHRCLRIAKVRARPFAPGWHDYRILTGGLEVYPALAAAAPPAARATEVVATGVPGLDDLLGGGLGRGTSTLLVGEPGSGKTLVALQFALAAAARREPVSFCIFAECARSVLHCAAKLDLPLEAAVAADLIRLHEVDSTAFTTGRFADLLRRDLREGVQHVVLDSLNGYRCAMATDPQCAGLHELLRFLNRQMVTAVAIAGRDWLAAADRAGAVDLSYIADTVIAFENRLSDDEIHPTIRVRKRRGGPHQRGLHRLAIGPGGVRATGLASGRTPPSMSPPAATYTGVAHGGAAPIHSG